MEYLDVTKPLPAPAALPEVRGILSWAPALAAYDDPRPICRWLDSAMKAGVRVALVGQVGLFPRKGSHGRLEPECEAALKTLGAETRDNLRVDPLTVKIDRQDKKTVGMERQPDITERGVVPVLKLEPGSVSHLSLALNFGAVRRTDPVATTPRGGISLDPFFMFSSEEVEPKQYFWITDPFAFFERAFATAGLPRPDPTTLSGRRLFLNRIDGDGFFNRSELDRRMTSGEIFEREILERHPDLPMTISLIAGYYDLALYNDPASLKLTRRILARTNVEPASHAYAHPLVWKTGAVALQIPKYTMNPRKEIVGSGKMIEERLLPPGRRIRLFQWTGDCLPSEGDLRLAREAGLLQINGGGGRFDRRFPSYAHLYPLSRSVGAERQIYAPTSNENDFTNLWSGPYYGYREVVETFERTGSPRRIKPVDLYYHFYSAEKFAALDAVKKAHDWAAARPLIPIWSGRYAEIVEGFFQIKIHRPAPGRFRLEGGASLRTIRFDEAAGWPDLGASKGVIGYKREVGSLYVSLAETAPRSSSVSAPGPEVRLEEADFEVFGWNPASGGVDFRRDARRPGECVLGGLSPGRSYRARAPGLDALIPADARGLLRLRLPAATGGLVQVEVRPA